MKNFAASPAGTALRVGAHLVRDRIVRPKATARADVPTSVDAITPQWWTSVLCGDVPGAEVMAHQIVSGSSGTHARHRFALTYNAQGQQAGLPTAVFTKSLPTLVTRMIGGYNGTARAEGRFYTQIRPSLELEAPLGYYAAFDKRTLACINVLEDIVVTRKATFCDYRVAVDRGMAEEMIDTLATLHGRSYQSPALTGDWRWVPTFADWFTVGARKMHTEYYSGRAIERAADVIPKDVLARRNEIWPATVAAAQIHRSAPFSLLHSDVHIGNWYQTGEGRMGLCDWQCLTKGHGSRDIAYLLSASLTPENRSAWERELIARYLMRFGDITGVRIAFDDAWDDYRRQMLHALWMWTITLCHSRLLPAMQSEAASLTMIARMTRAISELGSLDAALK
jgi:Phosphotransferase enzyme family